MSKVPLYSHSGDPIQIRQSDTSFRQEGLFDRKPVSGLLKGSLRLSCNKKMT